MFSYYGTKRALAGDYPKPSHDVIVEPFAGAAAYSCLYPDRNVILYDLDPIVVATWDYLIHATPDDILSLPDMEPGSRVSDFDISVGARYLMGFAANPGSAQPKITATKRCRWNQQKLVIASKVNRIKHWSISLLSFDKVANISGTWFIDPPYQTAGSWYRKSAHDLNFRALAHFCQTRNGQVIVCEQAGADWLPFRPFKVIQGSRYQSAEVWWTMADTERRLQQS